MTEEQRKTIFDEAIAHFGPGAQELAQMMRDGSKTDVMEADGHPVTIRNRKGSTCGVVDGSVEYCFLITNSEMYPALGDRSITITAEFVSIILQAMIGSAVQIRKASVAGENRAFAAHVRATVPAIVKPSHLSDLMEQVTAKIESALVLILAIDREAEEILGHVLPELFLKLGEAIDSKMPIEQLEAHLEPAYSKLNQPYRTWLNLQTGDATVSTTRHTTTPEEIYGPKPTVN